jgi:HAMP domain-containing protein
MEGRMAEIHLERKEKSSIIPWVLVGLALLALVGWWIMRDGRDLDSLVMQDEAGEVADARAAEVEGAPGEVNSYLRFVEENRARDEVSRDHSYTADGIRELAGALHALAEQEESERVAVEPRVEYIRERADALERDAEATTHAGITRDAFTNLADVMEMLRQRYSGAQGDVSQVREAANAIEPNTLLTNQAQHVQTFFERSATAVRTMAQADQQRAGAGGMGMTGTTTDTGTGTAGAVPPR